MATSVGTELAGAAAEVELLERMVRFVGWVGDERKLTQTGRLTLSDARHLVGLLGTGDRVDPKIGDRVFRTKSSEELTELTTIVEWAKATRLVRVTGGRLAQVKKNAAMVDRPAELWARMFEVFPQLGKAVCPSGWAQSLMRDHFDEGIGAVLRLMYARGGTARLDELCTLGWETVTARYVIDGTPQQLDTWRRINDRDVKIALGVLQELRAVRVDEGDEGDKGEWSASLTDLGTWATRRSQGEPEPGDPVLQIRVTLAETSNPAVWRRLLVPAGLPLDRLHQVIQTAMGWQNYHFHVFSDGSIEYGRPNPELEFRDERKVALSDLAPEDGDRIGYTYDFGDNWEHEIVVEATLPASRDRRYPVCVAGEGACPPEDCGGVGGYEELREVLADPGHEEHESMLRWMGLQKASDFDPARADLDEINRALLQPGRVAR